MTAKTFALIIVSLMLCAVSSAQENAIIDNCCFVNRQCATNQEWEAGWHAFQRNECPASQPAAPTSAPVSAPAGQLIDNCCYVDRQCQSDAEWVNGYWAYQNGQCAAAPAQTSAVTPTRPRIEGSSNFVRHVSMVMDWLESAAPEWFHYLISGLDVIVEVPIPDQGIEQTCTASAHVHERKASLETCWTNRYQITGGFPARMDVLRTAPPLVHEACHVHRHEAGFVYDASTRDREELECNKVANGVEVALDPHSRYGRSTFLGEPSLNVVRRYCREGFNPELYCPAIQRLQGG